MTALYGLLALVIGVFLWLANGVRRIGAVSVGSRVETGDATALLLIDLQTVFWDDGPYSDQAKSEAQAVIEQEVAQARKQGDPIIAVRQEWSIPSTKAIARLTMKGQAIAGTPGTELADAFANVSDATVTKRVQDAFETKALAPLLEGRGVGAVRIVGLDFNHCVAKTAMAARNRGYDVTVVTGGTLAAAPTEAMRKTLLRRGVQLA